MVDLFEKLEVINDDDMVIGLKPRTTVHKEGLLHREIHVWFFTPEGKIIFQRRSSTKDTYPNKLDSTVGGHVEPGMSYEETAVKEAKEETGFDLDLSKLHLITRQIWKSHDKVTGMTNNALRSYYVYLYDGLLSDLKVESEDGGGFEAWSIDALCNLSETDKDMFIGLTLSDFMIDIFKTGEKLLLQK